METKFPFSSMVFLIKELSKYVIKSWFNKQVAKKECCETTKSKKRAPFFYLTPTKIYPLKNIQGNKEQLTLCQIKQYFPTGQVSGETGQ